MSGLLTQNYELFRSFSDKLDEYSPSSPRESLLLGLLQEALRSITFNHDEYDALTRYSARTAGETLVKYLRQPLSAEVIERTLYILAGFIREASLVRDSRSASEQRVLDYFLEGYKQDPESVLGEWQSYAIDFVRNVLPSKLIEEQRRSLGQIRADIEKARADSVQETERLEERIRGYQAELKKLESEYNFVGLSDAFSGLLDTKRWEKHRTFALIVVLALSAVAVPAWLVLGTEQPLFYAYRTEWAPRAITILVASVGVEIVLLYYFRIGMRSFLSVQNQVTNLRLRLALCQFIEGYLEFASKASKSGSKEAIASFESLIFGNLPSESERLPATLEGIEQIANIVKSIREK